MGSQNLPFDNKLKGNITQVILKTLLEDVGYNVVPFGVEEVFREIKELEKEQVIELPTTLRKMPDFIVINQDKTKVFMVEVKYRKKWDEDTKQELSETLIPQLQTWNPIYVMMFIGEIDEKLTKYPARFARIAKVTLINEQLHILYTSSTKTQETPFEWQKVDFNRLAKLQKIFPKLMDKKSEKTLEKMLPLLETLRNLEEKSKESKS